MYTYTYQVRSTYMHTISVLKVISKSTCRDLNQNSLTENLFEVFLSLLDHRMKEIERNEIKQKSHCTIDSKLDCMINDK